MNFTVWNDTAPNGAIVNSRVVLLIPDADETFPELPWRSESSVNGCTLHTSHHKTKAEASANAERMHTAYLEVHAGAVVVLP